MKLVLVLVTVIALHAPACVRGYDDPATVPNLSSLHSNDKA